MCILENDDDGADEAGGDDDDDDDKILLTVTPVKSTCCTSQMLYIKGVCTCCRHTWWHGTIKKNKETACCELQDCIIKVCIIVCVVRALMS